MSLEKQRLIKFIPVANLFIILFFWVRCNYKRKTLTFGIIKLISITALTLIILRLGRIPRLVLLGIIICLLWIEYNTTKKRIFLYAVKMVLLSFVFISIFLRFSSVFHLFFGVVGSYIYLALYFYIWTLIASSVLIKSQEGPDSDDE